MTPESPRARRGQGLLESFLARKRRDKANALIGTHMPIQSVLDIGCGTYPAFLAGIDARDRVGIDQLVSGESSRQCTDLGIQLIQQDITRDPILPFESARFDAVSMLAVVEHIPLDTATRVVSEVYRILRPRGVAVVTTPAAWTDPILRTLARLNLVSSEEIDEHQSLFTRDLLRRLLANEPFDPAYIQVGTFEFGMNLWARAVK